MGDLFCILLHAADWRMASRSRKSTSYREIIIGKVLYQLTSMFEGTKDLDKTMERLEVGEREEKWSHTAPQRICICYRDIGLLDSVTEQQEEQETPRDSSEVA
ncbi:hypothetical protein [Oscillibacter sp.]|uniref:hypothetical protein n=1 Tax=Oscillibacter sp. TaxID=1945593 RepID=UPI002898A25E|nr:hypothetical protein [Oscillibacter sp.]